MNVVSVGVVEELAALKVKLSAIVDWMQAITDKARAENRDMTPEENIDFDTHWAYFQNLDAQIASMRQLEEETTRSPGKFATLCRARRNLAKTFVDCFYVLRCFFRW